MTIQPVKHFSAWFAGQSRTVRDLIVMGAVGLPLYLLAVWYDALDKFLVLADEPQSDAIDWLVILFVFLGVAAKIYSVRRTVDLRREVVARRQAQAEAHQMARHDVLTGLPNRRRFIEDFNRSIENLPAGEACAMFVLDLDNFKPINDVYGHRLGDEVLKVISHRLTQIAEGACVARLGGDEFGVTLRYTSGSDAPERLARQIVHELARPIQLAALSLHVGASVGVATCDAMGCGDTDTTQMAVRDGGPVETMLRRADMAMYWAKSDGRGRYRFFDRSMDQKLRQRVELESRDRRRHRLGPDRPLLSAYRSSEGCRDHRLRGACALGASEARRVDVRGVHPHRRGHGDDRQDDRSAAGARHARCPGLALAHLGIGQFLAAANLRPERRDAESSGY